MAEENLALELVAPGLTVPDEVALREVLDMVWMAVERLSEMHRRVIVLRFYEDRDWQSVAELIGRSPGAAMQVCYRARIELHRLLRVHEAHRIPVGFDDARCLN